MTRLSDFPLRYCKVSVDIVIPAVHRERCKDVVDKIHYKPPHWSIKALLCGEDQVRGRLRLSAETPVVCYCSQFPLFRLLPCS